MCILLIKNRKLAIPSRETLATCFKNNPDGAGFCYNKNGTIILKKGFMTFDEFYAEAQKIPTESTALLHFRIGTSGGKTPQMTHPYPLTNNVNDLKNTNQVLRANAGGKVYAVAHNGIFSGVGYQQDINDTCLFISNILKPLADNVADIQSEDLDPVINRLVDTSRLAILDSQGNVTKYGNGWVNVDGIWYSNTTYKEYTYTYSNSKFYNYDDYDYDYDGLYGWSFKSKDNKVDKKEEQPKLVYTSTTNYGDKKKDNKSNKGCSTMNWYDKVVKRYGTYKEYLKQKKENKDTDLEVLKETYPELKNDIETYYRAGFSVYQINSWIESGALDEDF